MLSASRYVLNDGREYLGVYNDFPPEEVRKDKDVKFVGCLEYHFGPDNDPRVINTFKLDKSNPSLLRHFYIKRSIFESQLPANFNEQSEEINRRFGIRGDIHPYHLPVLGLEQKDILDFVKDSPSNPEESDVRITTDIRSRVVFKEVKPKYIIQGGKPEWVYACIERANLDHTIHVCMTQIVPQPGARIEGFRFINYILDRKAGCPHCYAIPKNSGPELLVVKLDEKQLMNELDGDCKLNGYNGPTYGKKIKILRLGKTTDTGPKFTKDKLIITLEACLKKEVRVVMPSKFLDFDKVIANLLRRTNSTLLYSTSGIKRIEELESGALAYGFDNAWRIDRAKMYRRAGVINTGLYLLVDAPVVNEHEKEIISDALENDLLVQFLPIRLNTKKVAEIVTGTSWSNLQRKTPPTRSNYLANPDRYGGYKHYGSSLVATELNPFFREMVGENNGRVRICEHHVIDRSDLESLSLDDPTYEICRKYFDEHPEEKRVEPVHCGKCFQGKGVYTLQKPPKIKYRGQRGGRWLVSRDRKRREKAENEAIARQRRIILPNK